MKMRKIFYALSLVTLFFTVNNFAQANAKQNAALEANMKKFISSIETKNTNVFLSFVSPTRGLTVMNTIDQGDAGNADKPVLDSKLEYKTLAADFKQMVIDYIERRWGKTTRSTTDRSNVEEYSSFA